ncbi:phosphatidylglycerol:prolipoprotein diacylglycerol transferase [Granulicella rosea]|uniref:Phosphatidylglycerol:prolipoprotein diacylglycerol transferase n=1 Tax=Granulicella rosea TaxID=474952 RepID=A0A239KQ20_9BACT|nr:prolipoprotein diacylglyceryl transferase family protein [Granulicella rosea]SNT20261.1 phosphatidylglycerol:prolipoprotein diacylglycerol transferase [Granulicella rosea]
MYPYLLHSGHLYLPTFGALAALGLMAALTLSLRTAEWVGISPDAIWNAGSFAALAAFLLSRLLLVATNFRSFLAYPMYLLAVPSLTPGGILLTLIAVGVWLWTKQIPLMAALDAWAPCATLVWVFLAVGHFAEGSDLGLPTSTWIGIALPGTTTRMIPVALFAAALALGLTWLLLRSLAKDGTPGRTFALAMTLTGFGQFVLSFWREPAEGVFGDTLDPLQWVAIGMMAVGVGFWVATQQVQKQIPFGNDKQELQEQRR